MDDSNILRRQSSSRSNRRNDSYTHTYTGRPSYRRDSNISNASIISDVEMAHEEVFSGPISESVPSSVTGFAHRRQRTESVASFAYFQEEDESPEWSDIQDITGDSENAPSIPEYADFDGNVDLESARTSRRKYSAVSRASVEDPLLQRQISAKSDISAYPQEHRKSQKLYIVSEDMTIVIAGFSTSHVGSAVYAILCACSLGLAYLVFRWLPRWKVRLVGISKPLYDCNWVVLENQWGEMSIQSLLRLPSSRVTAALTGFKRMEHMSIEYEDEESTREIAFLEYRYMRFWFDSRNDKFLMCNDWIDPNWRDLKSARAGLDSDEWTKREAAFGKNQIDIREKTIPQLLVEEVLHPFYMFQVASLILWSLDEYYYYAVCIFLISLVSITTTLVETRATMRRLREISRFECGVRVFRSGYRGRQIPSSDLVPGDVYELSDKLLTQFPCDSLLLAGDCIVNESMLTGESVPVSKLPATDESLYLLKDSANAMHPELAKHFLFNGTKLIRATRPKVEQDAESTALAVVIRTGFDTTKGALVRSMLFPKPSGFKFYRDAFRYISVMAAIAGIGFTASLVNFIRLKLAWHLIIVRALDLITIVVPPALPATLTIGTNFALSRLKQKNIFCISPQRVNVGGKLDVMCFDKTGTLTEDGLDVLEIRAVNKATMQFSEDLKEVQSLLPGAAYERDPTIDYRVHQAILFTMATCHSLHSVHGEILGDPLDVKMFKFTGWNIEEKDQKPNIDDESSSGEPSLIAKPPVGFSCHYKKTRDRDDMPVELGTLKSFEFISQLRRASVIVGQAGTSGGDIYVKGAPECMSDICQAESFPHDYESLLDYYTHQGFRVIACATKHINFLDWPKIRKMKREEAEFDLTFLGFIIFENKLKEITPDIIDELRDANIRSVMCTGDNILTAISVGRECGMIDQAHCFIPHFSEGGYRDPRARISWQSVDNSALELDEHTLTPVLPSTESDASLPHDVAKLRNYNMAISGDVFRWIVDFANEEIIKRMLVRTQIFARMSPDEKHELVEKLQSIEYCCGFCGDGANDCGALKAADVGISLSEAEASVAAPFTSRVFDISCVPEVIREGRAALVTSFCCFKYMSTYSAIQFISVSFLYASASNLGDFQYLFVDIFLVLPVAIFMGWTSAYPILSRKRPMASLVSRKVLTPLLGQIALCLTVQAIAYFHVRQEPWFIPPVLDKEKSNIENSENTALFKISTFQYIYAGIVLSVGPPFRQPMRYNFPFVITIVTATLICIYLLLDPADWLNKLMQFTPMPLDFKLFIIVLVLGGFACAWLGEQKAFARLAGYIGSLRTCVRPARKKKRKEYKMILEDMRQ